MALSHKKQTWIVLVYPLNNPAYRAPIKTEAVNRVLAAEKVSNALSGRVEVLGVFYRREFNKTFPDWKQNMELLVL